MLKHIDWAREMDKALTENLMMEKVASEQSTIKTVSEQDQPTDIELEMEGSVKTAGTECAACKGFYTKDKNGDKPCTCVCKTAADCAKGCECHSDPAKPSIKKEDFPLPYAKAEENVVQTLLKVSEDLDNEGFAKLAAVVIVLASKVVEAKAKKKKSKETKDSKKSKETKKTDKKMTTKERMEAMRKAKSSKKDTKKSTDKK